MNRSFAAGLFALVLLPGLSACGAGFEAETQLVAGDNGNGEVNGVLARAMVLVKGKQSPAAALAGSLINRSNKADVLTTVTLTDHTPGSAPVTISPNLPLAAGALIPLGTGDFKPLSIPNAQALKVGNFADLVLTFREAGPLRLQVETKDRTYYYEDVTPEGAAPPELAKETSKATVKPGVTPKPAVTPKVPITPKVTVTPKAPQPAE